MSKKFTVTSILVLVTCLIGINAFSQCPTTPYNEGGVAVGCGAFGASSNISSTAFRTFGVTNGVVYSISTCGSAWDSQLTVRDNSDNYKVYNDDNGPSCTGNAASVDWTADYTGTARAYVHRYSCGNTWPGTSAILQIRQNSTVTNTTSNATICTYQTKALTYTISSGTGVPTWSLVSGAGSISGTTFTPSAAGNVTVRATLGVCSSDIAFTVSAPTGNPAVFGNGVWNVYAYNAGDAAGGSGAWASNYSGFYTENNLGFTTTSRWTNSPSEANAASGAAYAGCPVNADNHSWSAKRTNIPCGVYQLQVQHDDVGQIFINGTSVYNNPTCCATTNAGTFVIVPSDNIEYRVSEGGGGSDGTIAFNNAFTALNAGSITYGGSTSGCIGFDPPAFGNGADASGGASASITGNNGAGLGTSTYQWQVNGGNISGANGAAYDAPAIATPGTYIYRRVVTDRCGNTAITNTFTITINPTNTIAAGVNRTTCINTAITSISLATTGATGATFSGLPAGVTGSWSGGTATISGTPTSSGTFNYTVTTTGGCPPASTNGTITVDPLNTIAAGVNRTTCINTAITSISLATTGATGATFSGLPAGVTGSWSGGTATISGTPTASGTFNYTVTTTGGCPPASTNGTITVDPLNTIAAGVNRTTCINTAITSISLATTGATGATFSGLPAGVTGSWSGGIATISGTPTASGTFNYTVTTTGGCPPASTNGTITVTPLNTIAAGVNRTMCINTAITSISLATTGATGATFSGLPAGVTGSWSGGTATISGTPTSSGTFNYTVTTTGGCPPASTNGTITVDPLNTIAAGVNRTTCINTAITSISLATTGATGATFSGLPAGVTGSWSGGTATISGTPTASGTFNYTVTTTGGCPPASTNGTITVDPLNTIAAGVNRTTCINTAITSISLATTGATGATFSGLPAGVTGSWSGGTATISGTPTSSGTFNYTVTTTGGCPPASTNGTITVDPLNTIAAGVNRTTCINTAITSISLATTGATGATFSGLPAGVTGSWSGGTATISGTPTASGTFNYTVTTTGGCPPASTNGTINVTPDNTVGVASSSPSVCLGVAIPSVTHTTTGATGIGAPSGLPTGVTAGWAANTITISGTPSASGTFNYSIPLTGGCGAVNATGTITVNGRPSPTFISVDPTVNVCRGTNVTYTTQSGQSNYIWSIPGTAGVDYQLVSGGNGTSNTAVIAWLAAGSGTVISVNYDNGSGCAAVSPTNSSAVTLPSAASALSSDGQSATCRVNGLNKIDFVNGTNLLLSLRSSAGVDLGDVTATSYVGGTGTVQACGTSVSGEPQFRAAYLGRRWVVQAPSAPASPAVEATLPFTSGELSSLATVSTTVTTANPFDDVNASNNGSDLILVKHTSSTEDGDPTNNCGSGTTVAVTGPTLSTVFGNPTVQYNFIGFSEWYLHGESNISPLPIVLTSFTAACEAGQVKLDWITATEINNDKFIITRSADMVVWDEVATISGAGNSNQPLYYTTTDLRPISGLSYYRLSQRDYDGTTETFAPISVTCYTDGNGNSMMVYPNPTDDKFNVSVTLAAACNGCSIEIYDINGKKIEVRNVSMVQGENTYTFDRASMTPGQYVIQLKSGDFVVKPVKLIVK